VTEGFEVEVVTRYPSPNISVQNGDDSGVYKILPAGAFGFRAARKLFRHLRQHSYQALIFQYVPHLYGRAGIAPLSGLIPLLARASGLPLVVTTFHEVHTRWDRKAAPPLKLRVQWFFQNFQASFITLFSHRIITTNPAYAKKLTRRGQPKVCDILPVGSNIPFVEISEAERVRWRSALRLPEIGGLLLVAFSPFTVGKDAGVYRKILEEMPQANLLLLGGISRLADQTALLEMIRLKESYSRLQILPGPLNASEISGWLQAADIYLHPASGGASGRSGTLAAALQHGLPVIAWDGPETSPGLTSDQNIELVAPGNRTAFIAALQHLAANPALRCKIGREAARYYQERAGWDVNGAAHARILRDAQDTLHKRNFRTWRGRSRSA
jgi:glycosyltransferase involved in cell wall biosynthesis